MHNINIILRILIAYVVGMISYTAYAAVHSKEVNWKVGMVCVTIGTIIGLLWKIFGS